MTDKKIIAIAGATGAQGGGTARAILADPDSPFAVRALTRDPGSAAAKELARLGADIVRADFGDGDSLGTAFDGAYGAFLVTNFWAHGSAATETEEIRHLAAAAKTAGLSHVVWSTLEDTRDLLSLEDTRMPVLQERYNVPHFDAKGEGNALFTRVGVPTTFLNTTFFYQGFAQGMGPRRGEDGALTLSLPFEEGKLLAGIDVNDIGHTAYAILRRGEDLVGQTVSIAGDHLTGHQYAAILAEALGEPVRFQSMPYDAFRQLPIPAADEIANMFQYYGDFDDQFTAARDLDAVRDMHPGLKDFRTWALENAAALKAAM